MLGIARLVSQAVPSNFRYIDTLFTSMAVRLCPLLPLPGSELPPCNVGGNLQQRSAFVIDRSECLVCLGLLVTLSSSSRPVASVYAERLSLVS